MTSPSSTDREAAVERVKNALAELWPGISYEQLADLILSERASAALAERERCAGIAEVHRAACAQDAERMHSGSRERECYEARASSSQVIRDAIRENAPAPPVEAPISSSPAIPDSSITEDRIRSLIRDQPLGYDQQEQVRQLALDAFEDALRGRVEHEATYSLKHLVMFRIEEIARASIDKARVVALIEEATNFTDEALDVMQAQITALMRQVAALESRCAKRPLSTPAQEGAPKG